METVDFEELDAGTFFVVVGIGKMSGLLLKVNDKEWMNLTGATDLLGTIANTWAIGDECIPICSAEALRVSSLNIIYGKDDDN